MKTLLISFAMLFITTQAIAQKDTLIGPHGGRLKIAQGYKIETLGCDNFLEVYLYNEATQPVFNSGITGEVKFFYEKKNTVYALQPYGIDGFTCKIESPDFSNYHVTMNLHDKLIITTDFNECIVPKY